MTTADQITALGGSPWTSPDQRISRVYLKGDALARIIGLDLDRYKTGNIRSATLAGQAISNAEAKRLADATVYWQDGDLYVQTTSSRGDDILAAVEAAAQPATDPEPAPAVEPAPAPAAPTGEPEPTADTAMTYMLNLSAVNRMRATRGPRWLVSAIVRSGQYCAAYATTAERAQQLREGLEGKSYRGVQVVPPDGDVDLAELGRARREAKAALDDATALLRAAVVRKLEAGETEIDVAHAAGVDRMTVRSWAGKR